MKIKYELVSVEKVGKNTIILIGRDSKNNKKTFNIKDFFPYIYVKHGSKIPTIDTLDENRKVVKSVVDPRIKSVEEFEGFALANDTPLDKIFLNDLRDTRDVRALFDETFEADIMFALRFKIDHGIKRGFKIERQCVNQYYISEKDVEGF